MPRYLIALGSLFLAGCATIGFLSLAVAQSPDSDALEAIQQTLEGNTPTGPVGDGVLEDILGVLGNRGSILKGSSLDPNATDADEAASPDVAKSSRAHAAEQLLRASRLLERLDSDHSDRAELVNRMRAEAVKLLLE